MIQHIVSHLIIKVCENIVKAVRKKPEVQILSQHVIGERVEKRGNMNYYFNKDNVCFAIHHVDFDKEMLGGKK